MFACFSSVRPPQSDFGNLRAMVDRYTEEFNTITEITHEKRRAQDLEDLNHERCGVQASRMQRFLNGGSDIQSQQSKKDKETQQLQTLLDIMMLDQDYAVLWHKVGEDARNAQAEIGAFQKQLRERLAQTDIAIAQMLEEAVTLPDGRKAFMNKEGEAFTANGDAVDPDIAAGINWEGTKPHEDFLALHDMRGSIISAQHRTHEMEVQIGDIQNRHSDKNDPPTKEELKADGDSLQSINREVEALRNELGLSGVSGIKAEIGTKLDNLDSVPSF